MLVSNYVFGWEHSRHSTMKLCMHTWFTLIYICIFISTHNMMWWFPQIGVPIIITNNRLEY